ncbi:unnamed protein product [Brassica oleracea]
MFLETDLSGKAFKNQLLMLKVICTFYELYYLFISLFSFCLCFQLGETITMRTFSWSTCRLLTHIAYGDGIWNHWVSIQCKHFQICDKFYEAEQMHEDRESHICLIFKTNSTADSLHVDKFAALGKSRVYLIYFFPTKYGLSFGFNS